MKQPNKKPSGSDLAKLRETVRKLTVRGGRITPVHLTAFNVQTYGETCTVKIKAGPAYDHFLIASNAPPNAIEKVVLTRGGADDVVISGSNMVLLEDYKNRPNAGTAVNGIYFYVVPFAEIVARSIEGMSQGMYVTLPGENITLNVHIREKALEAGYGETWPEALSLKASGYTTAGKPGRIWMPEIKSITTPLLPTGEVDFFELPQDVYYKRLFLTGDITHFELKQNGKNVIEKISVDEWNFHAQRQNPDLNLQAGTLIIDFIGLGFANADIFNPRSNTDQDLKLSLTLGTSGHIPILVDGLKRVN